MIRGVHHPRIQGREPATVGQHGTAIGQTKGHNEMNAGSALMTAARQDHTMSQIVFTSQVDHPIDQTGGVPGQILSHKSRQSHALGNHPI
jgi:hypothetical protein